MGECQTQDVRISCWFLFQHQYYPVQDIKDPRHFAKTRAQKLCSSRGGHPGLPSPLSPYGLCGHKTTCNFKSAKRTGGNLQLNYMLTPQTRLSQRGLTMLSRHSMGTNQGNKLARNLSRNAHPQSPQLAVPLWWPKEWDWCEFSCPLSTPLPKRLQWNDLSSLSV